MSLANPIANKVCYSVSCVYVYISDDGDDDI